MAGANRDTPAMRQYAAFKKRYPDCVLFFRMGDFYEMFDEDAKVAHRVLGITLTERTAGIPMAGVPYHSVESYLRKMIERGYRVAVCDQVQDAREAKGVVERAVTRVLTPGTLVDEALLKDERANNLAGVVFLDFGDSPDGRAAAAVVELSTGAFTLLECRAAEMVDELARRGVDELVFAEPSDGVVPPRVKRLLDALDLSGTPRPAWHFRREEALESIFEQYGVATLGGFGLDDEDPGLLAAGAVIRYLRETQAIDGADLPTSEGFSSGSGAAMMLRKKSLAHLAPPKRVDPGTCLRIDAVGLRALEVERTIRTGTTDGALLGVFFKGPDVAPRTAMGKRLLRDWLCSPLADADAIAARQNCVALLAEDRRTARDLCDALQGVQDVARITARVGLGRATPRDLVALGRSLTKLAPITEALEGAPAFAAHLERLTTLRADLSPVAERIAEWCVDDPPAHLREGGLIRDGIDPELDEARSLQTSANEWLARYQAELVKKHELPSLKVGLNKVFGYYIELPAAQSRRAPETFTRKQTLKNAERYITPELKEFEDKVLTAGERAVKREQDLFGELCDSVSERAAAAAGFAEIVAELDALATFASKAVHRGWVRPEIVAEPVLDIRGGRHPVLEQILEHEFVPNDCTLGVTAEGEAGARLALITGPNMAGKSTYIRQVALIALLAHTGSFVPAERATVGLADRIFTRVGADDALHKGQSTFMVEMTETANILHHATDRSLVILDEIGRGTSTLDGLSLAWAIAEKLGGAGAAVPVPPSDGATERRSDEGEGKTGSPPDEQPSVAPSLRRSVATPRTLFATHYHEITDLAERTPTAIKNLHVAVREWGEEIVFLHRILPGRANRSFGVHVARLAGLPRDVVDRAKELLDSLSVSHEDLTRAAKNAPAPKPGAGHAQMALFTEYVPHPAVEELKALDLNRMSPMDAFEALRNLADAVRNE